ncbi:MAG: hypothetical protein JO061_13515, partial [Acidobacteriaceae bacterium]|nr:hypothetical protein [Acidobacteriaceae bacterium]
AAGAGFSLCLACDFIAAAQDAVFVMAYSNVALSPDGGATWHLATAFPSGYRSGGAWDRTIQAWIAVGPNGSDLSRDDGHTWKRFDSGNWNALSLPWVVGPHGRIASLDPNSPTVRPVAIRSSRRPPKE